VIYNKVKEELEAVEHIIQSLCMDDYKSPDAYFSNFEFVQNRYVSLSDLANVSFLEWLAERDSKLYLSLVRWATTVSAIGGCIANLYPEDKEHIAMH